MNDAGLGFHRRNPAHATFNYRLERCWSCHPLSRFFFVLGIKIVHVEANTGVCKKWLG